MGSGNSHLCDCIIQLQTEFFVLHVSVILYHKIMLQYKYNSIFKPEINPLSSALIFYNFLVT